MKDFFNKYKLLILIGIVIAIVFSYKLAFSLGHEKGVIDERLRISQIEADKHSESKKADEESRAELVDSLGKKDRAFKDIQDELEAYRNENKALQNALESYDGDLVCTDGKGSSPIIVRPKEVYRPEVAKPEIQAIWKAFCAASDDPLCPKP